MNKHENFTVNTEHMSAPQIKNVGRLLIKAEKLGWFYCINYQPMIQVGYNSMYGNTYIWSENEGYSLFISDFDNAIMANYSCPYDGEETQRKASNDIDKMNAWAGRCRVKSDKKENA